MKFKVQRAGSFVVKSAEGQASRVVPKIRPVRPQSNPSGRHLVIAACVVRAVKQAKIRHRCSHSS